MKTKSILSILMTFLIISSIASAVEIRGTVVTTDGATLIEGGSTYTWTAQKFAGFYYDLDKGESFESLTIKDIDGRTIPENNLVYETQPIGVNFSYSDNKNKPVYDNFYSYSLVGWQAEKWVSINGKPNKLVKLLVENRGSEKVTLQTGGSLTLGNGYVMKINSVDANAEPRQAWVSLMKNGNIVDDAVLRQGEVYNLRKDFGGETNVLILSTYVDSIFHGGESQMLQLQYLWMIDEDSFVEVKSGDTYGKFKVTGTNPLILSNSASMSLSRDSNIDLMGNMFFRVADSDTLRFYPYVDITDEVVIKKPNTIVENTPVPTLIPTPNVTVTEVSTPLPTPTPQIVYVTVTPEPTPIPTKPSPGFESVFAILGLIIVTFIVLKKRKD
jgi:S-layer protein (TIGR01567 family)